MRRQTPTASWLFNCKRLFQNENSLSPFVDGMRSNRLRELPGHVAEPRFAAQRGSSMRDFETMSSSYQVYASGCTCEGSLSVWYGSSHTLP